MSYLNWHLNCAVSWVCFCNPASLHVENQLWQSWSPLHLAYFWGLADFLAANKLNISEWLSVFQMPQIVFLWCVLTAFVGALGRFGLNVSEFFSLMCVCFLINVWWFLWVLIILEKRLLSEQWWGYAQLTELLPGTAKLSHVEGFALCWMKCCV